MNSEELTKLVDDASKSLGEHFEAVQIAARAYDTAARKHFGQFASPNLP